MSITAEIYCGLTKLLQKQKVQFFAPQYTIVCWVHQSSVRKCSRAATWR